MAMVGVMQLTVSGSASVPCSDLTSVAMIAGGVPARTISASQAVTWNPGAPDSARVGTSGKVGNRARVETASAFRRPDLTCGIALAVMSIMKSRSPAMSPVIEAAPLGDVTRTAGGGPQLTAELDRPAADGTAGL